MLLQVSVDRTQTAQPRKRTFGFMTQWYIRQFGRRTGGSGRRTLDGDIDQVSTRANAGIQTAGGDEFGLVARVAAEGAQEHDEILVGNGALVAVEDARNVAARESSLAGNIGLFPLVTVEGAIEGSAEVTHTKRGVRSAKCEVRDEWKE